jgi:hypothetical protein
MPASGRSPLLKFKPLLAAALAASGVLVSLALPCGAQTAPAAATVAPKAASPASAASRAVSAKSAASQPKAAVNGKRTTKPAWAELTEPQRQALAPLSGTWDTVSEAQKRKWLALAENFPRLAPAEQDKLRSRMTEWVSLSPQQRSQARLNFGETKKLAPDDKKAKWEAYQALPPEEKRKLAAGAAKPPATAAAVKPVAPEKLASVPKTGKPKQDVKTPRIAVAPNQVDHNTLLPQPAAPASPTN